MRGIFIIYALLSYYWQVVGSAPSSCSAVAMHGSGRARAVGGAAAGAATGGELVMADGGGEARVRGKNRWRASYG